MSDHKLYRVIFLCYVVFVVFLIIDLSIVKGDETASPRRIRRYLGFRNISRFFVRCNWKNNMVRWNQIFAEALGFKLSYDDPPDSFHPYRHIHRRDVYTHLETLLDKNGLNGLHCIRRAICEMGTITNPQGIYHRILKIVFRRQSSATDRWHNITEEACGASNNLCPFSILDVSLYTDV